MADSPSPQTASLADFVSENGGKGLDEFLAQYPGPFLLMEAAKAADADKASLETMDQWAPPEEQETKPKGTPLESTVRDHLVQVRRREGPAGDRITIGRRDDSDVTLPYPQVSKVHAYLTVDDGSARGTIVEAGSTNGTSVNRVPLDAGEVMDIHDGDQIVFGGDLPYTFMSAESLHRYLPVIGHRLARDQG